FFFFSSRRRHTRFSRDWSSDVCSSDLMNFAERNDVRSAKGVKIGMVSPDGRAGMVQHAAQFAEAGIPFVFDPGQGMPMFNGEERSEERRVGKEWRCGGWACE